MKHDVYIRKTIPLVSLLLTLLSFNTLGVEPAKTENGAFLESDFLVKIGPFVNYFAPVENMVTPEEYFSIIGVSFEKIDDSTYRVSSGEYTTFAQAYQLLQDHGIYTINPLIDGLELVRLFHPEVTGPPYQLERLWNFSVRAEVKDGKKAAIGGLVVPGNHAKIVVIRALGPTLGDYGIEEILTDPEIELVRSNAGIKTDPNVRLPATTKILENDDHLSSYVSTDDLLDWVGLSHPDHDNESLIATILDPGIYTTILSSANGETGTGLLEFYILDAVDVTNTPSIE